MQIWILYSLCWIVDVIGIKLIALVLFVHIFSIKIRLIVQLKIFSTLFLLLISWTIWLKKWLNKWNQSSLMAIFTIMKFLHWNNDKKVRKRTNHSSKKIYSQNVIIGFNLVQACFCLFFRKKDESICSYGTLDWDVTSKITCDLGQLKASALRWLFATWARQVNREIAIWDQHPQF